MDLEIKTDPMDGVDQGMLYYTQQMNLAPTFDLNVARYPYQQTYPGKISNRIGQRSTVKIVKNVPRFILESPRLLNSPTAMNDSFGSSAGSSSGLSFESPDLSLENGSMAQPIIEINSFEQIDSWKQ